MYFFYEYKNLTYQSIKLHNLGSFIKCQAFIICVTSEYQIHLILSDLQIIFTHFKCVLIQKYCINNILLL